MATWGPLQPLCDYLTKEDQVAEDATDRKSSDTSLAKLLSADDFSGALQTASLEQLDLALAHDALAVERKPLSFLTLLCVWFVWIPVDAVVCVGFLMRCGGLNRFCKSNKLEAWIARKGVPQDEKAAQRIASARLVMQLSQFLYQVPIYVAVKEIKRGRWFPPPPHCFFISLDGF